MSKRPVSLAFVAMLAASAAAAHDFKAGAIEIAHPWSRATVAGAKVAGGYFALKNAGSEPDRLVSVAAPFASKSEIHESSIVDGVARMREIEGGIEIAPGATVTFEPGGKHLMFIGLTGALKKGETVKGELTFEKAGKVEVEFTIEAAGAKPAAADEHKGH